jgi:hypothetical protein
MLIRASAVVCAFFADSTVATAACSASQLSQVDAVDLVFSIPEVLQAKEMGGRVTPVVLHPGNGEDTFFYFMLVSTVNTPAVALDNGLLGYFAVNKVSGRVIRTVDEVEVISDALKQKQIEVRHKHCVTQKVVEQNNSIDPP